MNYHGKRRQTRALLLAVLMLAALLLVRFAACGRGRTEPEGSQDTALPLSEAVLSWQPAVERCAAENGIEEDVDVLLAIMQVESGGELTDVMQSSGSAELPADTLGEVESIEQGCRYFAELKQKADRLGCDERAVIQAYNYGGGFLDYVAANGGKYTLALSEDFACRQSDGETIDYDNPLAARENGGWRYAYGNMFYTELVSQYLPQ